MESPHPCDTALWEVTSRSWHVRQRPPSSRDQTSSLQAIWHFTFPAWEDTFPAPWHRGASSLLAGSLPGGQILLFCNRSFYLKANLGKSTLLCSGSTLEAGKMPHVKLESSFSWGLHVASVTGSLGSSGHLGYRFSARMRQATHISRLSLSFSFLKWAANLSGRWWVIIHWCFFFNCVHNFSIFKCADCNSRLRTEMEYIYRVTLLLLSVQIPSPRT